MTTSFVITGGGLPTIEKDPSALLDYTLDWSAWLVAGDTILTAAFVAPPDLVVDDSSRVDTAATVWLSGGTHGKYYEVRCAVTTANGREDTRSFLIACRER
jgi:hypothetical protein